MGALSVIIIMLSNGLVGWGIPAAHSLQNQHSQMTERKGTFHKNASNLGRWWTPHLSKPTSKDSAQLESYGKRRRNVSRSLRWGPGLAATALYVACDSGDLPLDAVLVTVSLQDSEEKAKEELSHLLFIFISTSLIYGKNQQVRQGMCVCSIAQLWLTL